MPLSPPPVVDTRPLFRPVCSAFAVILRGLSADDWHRGTLAGTWTVRDVVAHLVDLSLRRVSFQRDALVPPPPPFPIAGERDFVRFINGLNHDWVSVTKRFSPQVLTELFDLASADLAACVEGLSLEAPGLFGVSWAGEAASDGWFDVGREFTELWHHQMQVRLAVGAAPLADPRYLHAVLEVSLRALPHAYREVTAPDGATMTIEAHGPAGGTWTLLRERGAWTLRSGAPDRSDARVRLSDDAAWRLLYNALPGPQASAAMTVEGTRELAAPLLRARSIVV
ncbi:MAG: maleylpyruvate isomerase N-terminal domain-containing protein [Acidobacteria bacterium]|nr:maleylpyruvate isomerase N-terminal domain-containing protein [Acidobacteriota bacterium]